MTGKTLAGLGRLGVVGRRNRHRTALDSETGARDTSVSVPVLSQLVSSERPLLHQSEAVRQAAHLRATATGLGIVERLLATPGITEIMINGTDIRIERNGVISSFDHELSINGLNLIIERMLGPLGLRLDRLNPIVDARLPDGSRVNVVGPELAIDGPLVSIRRFAPNILPLEAFGPPDVANLMSRLVGERRSMLIVGPTSSGKTTLVNSLSQFIGSDERVVTIEDTAELRLAGSHVVRLEARSANSEGVGEVSLRQLVKTALRLRPDRIVVGEVRGSEAFDLLLALTSGHAGSFCTCHAADALSALRRLEMLSSLADADLNPELVRGYVGAAIDVVITVSRVGGRRQVVSVDEVVGGDHTFELRKLWSEAES